MKNKKAMNSIQRYVLDSLFAQNQVTADSLAKALETFSNETAIDAFLTVLITGETDINERKIVITGEIHAKLQVIKLLKDTFNLGLKYAKDIVDEYTGDDNLTFPLKLVYNGKYKDLDVRRLKGIVDLAGYTLEIY